MVVVMAISLAVVMGFAALAFDLAYVRLARFHMQNATDAAAHAAMHTYRKEKDQPLAVATARGVAAANTVLGNSVTLLDSDVVFGEWNSLNYPSTTFTSGGVPNAVRINGRISDAKASAGSVELTFGKSMGFTEASVARSGIAAFRTRGVGIGLDVTGSFIYPTGPALPPVYQARTAALAFLKAMDDMNGPGDRIGLQLFTGRAQRVTQIQPLRGNYNSIKDAWEEIHICRKPGIGGWPPVYGPDDPDMPLCWARDDGMAYPTPGPTSNPGAALKALGTELLTSPSPYEMPVVVLITDGEPMCCTHQGGGDLCSKVPPGAPCCESGVICTAGTAVCDCAKGLKAYGTEQANWLHSRGISVFTISYIDSTMDAIRATEVIKYNRSLVRGIGKAYDSPNPAHIGVALDDIAKSIPVTLVK